MNKVIIVGSTSGIGMELAKVFYQNNYLVGIVGRRSELFPEIQNVIPTNVYFKRIDVSKTTESIELLNQLIAEMGEVDIVIISSGIGFINPDLEWEKEKDTIDVNTSGFAAMANVAYNYFCTRGKGQIFKVIKSKKKHAYITKRWHIIAWLLRCIPDFIYNRLGL